MSTSRFGFAGLRMLALASTVTALGGCPFGGDCWSRVDVTVKLPASVKLEGERPLYVVMESRIYDSDVRGVDSHDIPVTKEAAYPTLTMTARKGKSEYRDHTDMGDPYETWIYAYIDANQNDMLDAGDPYGIDEDNPTDLGTRTGCRDYRSSITLDRIYK